MLTAEQQNILDNFTAFYEHMKSIVNIHKDRLYSKDHDVTRMVIKGSRIDVDAEYVYSNGDKEISQFFVPVEHLFSTVKEVNDEIDEIIAARMEAERLREAERVKKKAEELRAHQLKVVHQALKDNPGLFEELVKEKLKNGEQFSKP